jgi:O-antigen/teichoic acid export membrane protein
MKTNLVFSPKLLALADQFVFSGGSFVLTLLLARLLAPEHFGELSTVFLFTYLLLNISNALVLQPLQVSLARVEEERAYISFSFFAQLLLVVLLCAGFGVLSASGLLGKSFLTEYTLEVALFSAGFLLHDYFRKIMLARTQLFAALLLDMLSVAGQLLATAVLLYVEDANPAFALQVLALAYVAPVLAGVFQLGPRWDFGHNLASFLQIHYQQGRWLVMTAVVQWWSSNLFVVASGLFLGMKALGAFRLAQSLFGVVNIFMQTFENYVVPAAARAYAADTQAGKSYIQKSCRELIYVFGPVLLLLFFFSDQVMSLAGGEAYVEYGYAVKGMVGLYALIFVGLPLRMSMRILVLNRFFFQGYLFSLAFSMLACNYLLQHWQMMGAIIGLMASQVIVLGYYNYILLKQPFNIWK